MSGSAGEVFNRQPTALDTVAPSSGSRKSSCRTIVECGSYWYRERAIGKCRWRNSEAARPVPTAKASLPLGPTATMERKVLPAPANSIPDVSHRRPTAVPHSRDGNTLAATRRNVSVDPPRPATHRPRRPVPHAIPWPDPELAGAPPPPPVLASACEPALPSAARTVGRSAADRRSLAGAHPARSRGSDYRAYSPDRGPCFRRAAETPLKTRETSQQLTPKLYFTGE